MSRTIYWEESLFFDYKTIQENKQDKENNKSQSENTNLEDNPNSKEAQKPKANKTDQNTKNLNPFKFSMQNNILEQIKEEFIKFCIYEYYDQGQEIFLCSTKIKITDMMKKTNKFLFDLYIKEKQLGRLKIGKL